ncbi:hypothetical protein [Paracoccus sp. (in: a-proteobacteria)]|nr:hypothetical protein [Paracoccus sp. (in: a-proteobacteria)]
MVRTIKISDYIHVQGLYEGTDSRGRLLVRVGERLYAGHPL